MTDFNWQKLPPMSNLPEVVEWAEVVAAPAIPDGYAEQTLAWKFGTNLMVALEAQYRILMMPPVSLELMKLQAAVLRDAIRQAIDLGHVFDKSDERRAQEIYDAIRNRMDQLGKA